MPALNIKIIFEDNHLLVVEKPVNILSQEDDTGDADLLTMLKDDIKIRYNKPGQVYLGLIHRLDRPVGGVMVFAKTSKAASRLSEQIRGDDFKKTYYAVVHGLPSQQQQLLKHYLIKDSKINTVKAFDKEVKESKEARLEYEVLGNEGNLSLVKVNLHTGRSHQIRVQLSTIGYPLYGDQKYGEEVNKPGQQIALWSTRIELIHPTLKEEMQFDSQPPEVFPWNAFEILL
jgi:23S rRNA pseudouridine1911/1915/1917 synthase